MWTINTFWFEVAVISMIYAVGNIVFGHFAEQTAKWRRVLKYLLTIVIVVALSYFVGRAIAFGFIGLLFLFVIYVHGIVLPKKGINGLTGEPKEKYYELRGWNKKK